METLQLHTLDQDLLKIVKSFGQDESTFQFLKSGMENGYILALNLLIDISKLGYLWLFANAFMEIS